MRLIQNSIDIIGLSNSVDLLSASVSYWYGITGPAGPTGPTGPQGIQGATGAGVGSLQVSSGSYSVILSSDLVQVRGTASGTFSIAIGDLATASNQESLAFGRSSLSSGDYTIAIGSDSRATASQAVSIGRFSRATGVGSIAILGTSSANDAISMGRGARAEAVDSISIGRGSRATLSINSRGQIAIGGDAIGTGGLAIGPAANNGSSGGTIILGEAGSATFRAVTSVIIGRNANVGNLAASPCNDCVVIGDGARANGDRSMALGRFVYADTVGTTLLGVNSSSLSGTGFNTAIDGTVTGVDVLAIRGNATGTGTICIGGGWRYITPLGTVGGGSTASGTEAIVIGKRSVGSGVNSLSIGGDNRTSATQSIVIGSSASSTHTNAIVIGQGLNSLQANTTHVQNLSIFSLTSSVGSNVIVGSNGVLVATASPTFSYGSFYDTTTQSNAGATAVNYMSFDTTDLSYGVSIVSSSQITMAKAGIYNIQFSAQFDKTDAGDDDVEIWLVKNGTNVDNSTTVLTLTGNNNRVVAAWNFYVSASASDYYQLAWHSSDVDMRILSRATQSNPDRPAVPSIILTVNQLP
jgi:hypothetical protein